MAARSSLSTVLSQALIAFTIEFDNEAERQIAERTPRPRFRVSLVMWSNYLRFVGDDGVAVTELQELAGDATSAIRGRLGGLTRWGYVVVDDGIVRATPAGRRAEEVWRPLVGTIERRWRSRFGEERLHALRASLVAVAEEVQDGLPRYLPVLSYADGMRAPAPRHAGTVKHDDPSSLEFPALLSRALLTFTLEVEASSALSLAIGANVLRVLDDEGVRVRDLPAMTGVSKEAVSASLSFLERRGFAVVEPDPTASRGKRARLISKGLRAKDADSRLKDVIERTWSSRFGGPAVDTLMGALDQCLTTSEGLRPPPGGWRAQRPYLTQTDAVLADPRGALPHHPMVLHRGGWPDGA